jgi:hypothetical protein
VRGIDLDDVRGDARLGLRCVAAAQVAVARRVVGHQDVRGRERRNAIAQRGERQIGRECRASQRRQFDRFVRAERRGIVGQFPEHEQDDLGLRIRGNRGGR